VTVKSRKKKKISPRFMCTPHGLDVCASCCMDFIVVNMLARLHYQGQSLPAIIIEEAAESHFATFELGGSAVNESLQG